MVLDPENPAGGYYYIDYPFHKIRVINLNTSDNPIVVDENGQYTDRTKISLGFLGVRQRQLEWLAEALCIKEENWSVLVVSHAGLTIDGCVNNREILITLLNAFKNREKGRVSNDNEYFKADISYDFTTNKSNDLMPYLCGHNHLDTVNNVDGIIVVSTRNLLGDNKNPEWDNPVDISYGSWDCMLLDKINRKLTIKRYKQPQFDREIDY